MVGRPRVPRMSPAVETQQLVVSYAPGRNAVDGVSLRVEAGEVVGLLGPNGSGKSTLFKVLATLLPPTGGAARVFGHDVAGDRLAVRRHLAVVFQQPALDKELTGRENLVCHGKLYGLSGPELKQKVAGLIDAVGLADRADEPTKRLSGGMRRRMEIAKGLLTDPPLLLMDEPTSGLDPAARRQVWELLDRLRRRLARPPTVLVTTHLMDEAGLCERLILLDAGKVVAQGTPQALVERMGGDVVTLVPERAGDAEALSQRVTAEFGIDPDSVQKGGGVVRIERASGHELLSEVMARRTELAVREASVGRPTLEDVFLRLTGRGLGDGAPPLNQ